MNTVTDYLHFVMPVDQELQFSAIATMQESVNTYDARSKNSDASGGKQTSELEYTVDISQEDWTFFSRAGLVLSHLPQSLSAFPPITPDMLIDMSDARLARFMHSGKHCSSVCNLLAGVACPAIPKIKAVVPRTQDHRWLVVGLAQAFVVAPDNAKYVVGTGEELLTAQDKEWTGIISYAGRWTYLAAAFGIGVIELQPPGRPFTWLSKYVNSGYRVVSALEPHEQRAQIMRAIASVERK